MTHRRSGNAMLFLLLLLTVLAGVCAVVVDLGYAWYVQAELQAGADAAALAAVRSLNRTARGVTNAREAALQVAALNEVEGAALSLDGNPSNTPDGDVVFGLWDGTGFVPSTDAARIDAVQVRARRSVASTGLSDLAFGRASTRASARSIAVQGIRLGASEVPFYLPFALPRCLMEHWPKTTLAQMTFVLNPANADNVGWGLINTVLSASNIQAHIAALLPCMNAWYTNGYVGTECTHATLSETIHLGNGEAESALKYLASVMGQGVPWDPTVWGPLPPRDSRSAIPVSQYGKMIAGPLPIFDGGEAYCAGADSWTGSATVTGFVWAAVYDIRSSGSATDRNVWLRIDPITYREIGEWYGGPDYGLVYVGPAVVVR